MPYYLRHYFDPNFDHTTLKPRPLPGGRADMRNLGYVQNVLPGKVLAEFVPLESLPAGDNPVDPQTGEPLDPRFILEEPVFPSGRHTSPSAKNPMQLIARSAGYVFYENGLIAVKTLLNIRGDVNFLTGNINFVGNVYVHHDVANGFSVKGEDVLIDGVINNARVRARRDLAVKGGVRGDVHNRCVLIAGRNMSVHFSDRAELRTGNNLDVNHALHSVLLVGGNLLAEKNILEGICRVQYSAVIRGDLGNSSLSSTQIFLGPNPFISRALHRNEERLEVLQRTIEQCGPLADHLPPDTNECSRRLSKARQQSIVLQHQQAALKIKLQAALEAKSPSVLYVGGTVFPGTIICINNMSMQIRETYEHVSFQLEDGHIVAKPFSHAL